MTRDSELTPTGSIRVAVPGGLWREDGVPLRHFSLRPVGDADSELLLDSQGISPAARANALLGACMCEEAAQVGSLTVGDRDALLLHLRRISLGDVLDCELQCPAHGCRIGMEMRLRASDLLLPAYTDVLATHVLLRDAYQVRFRLPRAQDFEDIAASARTSPADAAAQLLGRCVLEVSHHGAPLAVEHLPAALGAEVAQAMVELDPQSELSLEWTCSECGTPSTVIFDIGSYFLKELDRHAARLAREVHILARHYHWREQDILHMSPSRRAVYLGLCSEAATRQPA